MALFKMQKLILIQLTILIAHGTEQQPLGDEIEYSAVPLFEKNLDKLFMFSRPNSSSYCRHLLGARSGARDGNFFDNVVGEGRFLSAHIKS